MQVSAFNDEAVAMTSSEGHLCTIYTSVPVVSGETVLVEIDDKGDPVRLATIAWEEVSK